MSDAKACSLLMKPVELSFPHVSSFRLNEAVSFNCQFGKTYQDLLIRDVEGAVTFCASSTSAKNYDVVDSDGRAIGKISKANTFSTYWKMSHGATYVRIDPEHNSQMLEPLALKLSYVRSGGIFSPLGLLAHGSGADLQKIGVPILMCGMYIAYAHRFWWSAA